MNAKRLGEIMAALYCKEAPSPCLTPPELDKLIKHGVIELADQAEIARQKTVIERLPFLTAKIVEFEERIKGSENMPERLNATLIKGDLALLQKEKELVEEMKADLAHFIKIADDKFIRVLEKGSHIGKAIRETEQEPCGAART